MRILVVEDELKMAALLRRVLERDGFTVDVVGSGEDALASAETITFDTIVLDRMLPGIDGLEVCRRLRAYRVLSLILMISACGEAGDLVAGLDAGALDYLVKPFPPRGVARAYPGHERRESVARSAWTSSHSVRCVSGRPVHEPRLTPISR